MAELVTRYLDHFRQALLLHEDRYDAEIAELRSRLRVIDERLLDLEANARALGRMIQNERLHRAVGS